MRADPSKEYIDFICGLYGDMYDDREEDSKPGGENWEPGREAFHKSLGAFQRELEEVHDIKLSTSKILKILITGNCWSTERTREVAELYENYTESGLTREAAIKEIAEELEISVQMVCMSLPYGRVVYELDDKSSNARRCDRAREKRKNGDEWRTELWQNVIDHAGEKFVTSGRGSRPGVEFSYTVSSPGGPGGRKYSGPAIEGYGNEMWVKTSEGVKKKSISRSTVERAYTVAQENEGKITGPRALGVPGAGSYLYALFTALRVIEKSE